MPSILAAMIWPSPVGDGHWALMIRTGAIRLTWIGHIGQWLNGSHPFLSQPIATLAFVSA